MKISPGLTEILVLLFFAIPIFVSIWMFWLCWSRARDPERVSISVQYEPPDNLSPGECGALLENVVAMNVVTATIVDLSVKGYLAIKQEGDASLPAAQSGKNYVFCKLKEQSEWDTLKPHEKAVLAGIFLRTDSLQILSAAMSRLQNAAPNSPVAPAYAQVQDRITEAERMFAANPGLRTVTDRQFGPKNEVSMLELQNKFYMHLQTIRNAIFDSIVTGGYYEKRPDQIRLLFAAAGIGIGLLVAVVGFVLGTVTRTPLWPWVLAGVLTGAIIFVAGRMMTPRTVAGSRALAKVLGLRDFLGRVEKDQIARVEKTPDLFEKYLPYAMALRVETNWSKTFGGVGMPSPQWYGHPSSGDYHPADLMEDLNAMSSQAESVMASRPGGRA